MDLASVLDSFEIGWGIIKQGKEVFWDEKKETAISKTVNMH